ncbi:Molybdenum cofactor synthesis domain protein [Pseudodesulfovibrio profundus]|uniref:Molybdopterin adenylyltransferase n=1 Tax=Pseudodesulfovibrio profundus TaxID=57320 RepID=A0A2C8F5B2_9BACT|nr:MogA/MoaB family molybdenum cofactor biosynthesis protein [Pseudodesulfovibrio profundus]MBC16223.1 molybdenum cofactor biosynthesis protein [Desulfovibrio sp.]SOB57009.1 Molybdenum cofactor synthesis domain protein [Pseudodesulfovibrio profundus]HBU38196.1 MogA/MoaB family molybdenum cofactor biosynthesis protein [Planctomycetaceae bacterium]|tara:strand:- start:12770 stop:13546 length:777 start_codon:yes stop_codon:yes gene_type:complete
MAAIVLSFGEDVQRGDRFDCSTTQAGNVQAVITSPAPPLKVGDVLQAGEGCCRVLAVQWMPGEAGIAGTRSFLMEALEDCQAGEWNFSLSSKRYTLAWVTLSDKGAAGKRADESGPLIGEMVAEKLDLECVQGFIIPDEADQLKALLTDLALTQKFDLIMTTGGTGVGPRDITPEATLAVIEKRLPGYERAMTMASLSKTPHGAISRAVAGTMGRSVIINMPGSPKAVAECLEPLLPTLKHTLEKLQGDPSDCAELRA